VQLLGVSAEAVERSWPAGAGELASRPLLGSSAEVAAALAPLPARPLAAQCDAVCDAACLERELGDGGASLKALDEGLSSQLACLLHAARAQAAAAPAGSGLLSASLAASKQPSDADAEAVARTLAAALAALQAGRPGAAAAQLTVLNEEGAKRELLTAPSPAPAPPAAAVRPITLTQWDGRVASVGVGVLLLTAITGTVIALCTMPLGQDSCVPCLRVGTVAFAHAPSRAQAPVHAHEGRLRDWRTVPERRSDVAFPHCIAVVSHATRAAAQARISLGLMTDRVRVPERSNDALMTQSSRVVPHRIEL